MANGTYRAQRFRRGADDVSLSTMVAGFPVIYDSRRGLLSTLLRLPLAELTWLDEQGNPWRLPSHKDRRKGVRPEPPRWVRLVGDVDAELPYALDEVVLTRVLGVQEEDVGDYVRGLEGRTQTLDAEVMIREVIALINGDSGEESELVRDLSEAAAAHALGASTRVWPLGIVYDGAVNMTTHYLQNDLRALIRGASEIETGTTFHAYMTGTRTSTGRRAHLGCRGGRRLTAAQRSAAEQFLGSSLTAAWGPPGTGKTELILALCAQTLIERTSKAGSGEPPRGSSHPLLVVASTNNRAVDNVIEPLSDELPDERLPIALRVGSRQVIAEVTVPCLQRTARWLEGAQPSRAAYEVARRQLRSAVDAVRRVETPLLEARRIAAELELAEVRRDQLVEQLDEALRAPPKRRPSKKATRALRRALRAARDRVREELERLYNGRGATAKKGRRTLGSATLFIERGLAKRLAAEAIAFEIPAAPADDAPAEAWIEAFEDLTDAIDDAEDVIDELTGSASLEMSPDTIRGQLLKAEREVARLRALRKDTAPLVDAIAEVVDKREPGLFEVAMTAREAWATLNRDRLLTSVKAAIEGLEGAPTLRTLGRANGEAVDDLFQLFPVVGCTLLSMGNVFPIEQGVIPRVVIDEAGQCHPAYAVSAIARAEKVLVIGDTNQLEPVIELNEYEEGRVLRRLSLLDAIEDLGPYRVHRDAGASAQALATRAVDEVPTLRDHFRCQPEIIGISNRLCGYDLIVRTPRASLGDRCQLLRGPLVGLRTKGAQVPFYGSWRNDEEVRRVVEVVRELLRSGIEAEQIAVLTPYRGQLRALEAAMRADGVPLDGDERAATPDEPELFDAPPPSGVVAGTLHRFQGGERDVVVLSMVVSRERSLPFTNARVNLVNVAVSRARQHLIVIGNPEVLARAPVTRVLVDAIPRSGWIW